MENFTHIKLGVRGAVVKLTKKKTPKKLPKR